ncbi:MAG: ABC transporter permease [Clostridium sp.]
MIAFTIRNLKLFFRDRVAVFFSLLSVFIIIGLYALFLGDTMATSMKDIPDAKVLITSWITAGIIAVTSISTTLGSFSIMVNDKQTKIYKDFLTSPISRSKLVLGYLLSSFVIGVIMTIFSFIISELYIYSCGGEILSLESTLNVLITILISVLSSSAMVFFAVSFIKSHNAFSTLSTVIGTLIGFITGVYVPIGTLPEPIQLIVKSFPTSHSAALLRQILMEKPLENSFANIPTKYLETFKLDMGIIYKFQDATVSTLTSILILLGTAALFYILGILLTSKKSK